MPPSATLQLKQIVVTNTTGQQLLLVELTISCDECGETAGIIHGHHLRTLHEALGRVIEEHGDLCGPAGTVVERTEFQGVNDPKKAQFN